MSCPEVVCLSVRKFVIGLFTALLGWAGDCPTSRVVTSASWPLQEAARPWPGTLAPRGSPPPPWGPRPPAKWPWEGGRPHREGHRARGRPPGLEGHGGRYHMLYQRWYISALGGPYRAIILPCLFPCGPATGPTAEAALKVQVAPTGPSAGGLPRSPRRAAP